MMIVGVVHRRKRAFIDSNFHDFSQHRLEFVAIIVAQPQLGFAFTLHLQTKGWVLADRREHSRVASTLPALSRSSA